MVDTMRLISLMQKDEEFIDLVGRRPTVPLKERIIEIMEEAPKGTIFYYDFTEVREVNGSGIHEIVVKPLQWLYENFKLHDKFLVLKNLSEEYDHLYNIQITCNKEKVSILSFNGESYEIIGSKAGAAQIELLKIIYEQKQVSASDLAATLNKKHTLIATHLTKLYEYRLISRQEEQLQEGGRQYIYSSLF